MAAKKKSPMTKKNIIRHEVPASGAGTGETLPTVRPPERERPKMPERPKEKDAGFGVLKWVGGIIVALILLSTILFNRAGGLDATRGDKVPGEKCEQTVECAKGSVCYAYGGDKRHCMRTCGSERMCDPGYTCVSAATQKRRKGFRLTDVCVQDAKI